MRQLRRFLVLLAVTAVMVPAAYPQSRSKKQNESDFLSRTWVGGTINNNLRFGGGTFSFGMTPMAGYEFVPHVSIGPFVRLEYYYERLNYSPPYIKFESLDVGPGIFARVQVFRQYFAQIEYEHAFIQRPQTDSAGNPLFGNDLKVLKETIPQDYVYLGAGYLSGSNALFGISIHYNILDDFYSVRIPWDYRINIVVPLSSGGR